MVFLYIDLIINRIDKFKYSVQCMDISIDNWMFLRFEIFHYNIEILMW